MADYTPDRRVMPHLVALAGCAQSKLTEAGFAECWGGVITGAQIDLTVLLGDYPEHDTMWWVRLVNLGVGGINESDQRRTKCMPVFLATVGVGFATCYPIQDDGSPLTVDQQMALTDKISAAMMALWRALACCSWEGTTSGVGSVLPLQWTPLGPDGGAMGGEWSLQFEIINARPEPEET